MFFALKLLLTPGWRQEVQHCLHQEGMSAFAKMLPSQQVQQARAYCVSSNHSSTWKEQMTGDCNARLHSAQNGR